MLPITGSDLLVDILEALCNFLPAAGYQLVPLSPVSSAAPLMAPLTDASAGGTPGRSSIRKAASAGRPVSILLATRCARDTLACIESLGEWLNPERHSKVR